jgi:uncharacterized protein YegL
MNKPKRPGGELSARPLHFIWICDCSGSMLVDEKIQALNSAIKEVIPHMRQVAADNPNAKVMIRVVRFSTGAEWHVQEPTPVETFKWADLKAEGLTDMGKAMRLVAQALESSSMPDRALPPVLVLVSDGQPVDDFEQGLAVLMERPWGKKAVRIAIAIGRDADYEVLQKFIGHSELKPLAANNPEALVKHIKWASTAVLKAVSSPPSERISQSSPGRNVPIIQPAQSNSTVSIDDVW